MRVGLLVTGDTAVRAAHSLSGLPEVDELVVIGPAKSKSFKVVESAIGCDVLVGTGPKAPRLAKRHGVPLVWNGRSAQEGVAVWGANPVGLALATAERESDPRLVAVAHPSAEIERAERSLRFPAPVGQVSVQDEIVDGRPVAKGQSKVFGAVLVESANRKITLIDDGAFMEGVALAAGVAGLGDGGPVWDNALAFLEKATAMGLVMAES